jgi:DNA-binding FadR family transcriptional regulator
MLKPIDRLVLSDQVFEQLKGEIIEKRYRPGEPLPTERELCEMLKVNRSSIREALKRLEQARLIEVRQGEGSIVLDFRSHAGLDLLADFIVLGGKINKIALRSIFEFRLLICPEIARLAAMRIQDSELPTLAGIVDQIEACPAEDAKKFQSLDFDFLYTLVQASENLAHILIINSTKEIYFASQEFFAGMYQETMSKRAIYRQLYEAIRAHDQERSRQLYHDLIEDQTRRFFENYPLNLE